MFFRPRYAEMVFNGLPAAAQAYNRSLEHLDKKVSKYLNGNPIRVDGKPRASGVMDTVRRARLLSLFPKLI